LHKQEANTAGITRKHAASDLGIGFSTLSKWLQKSRPGDMPSAPDLDLTQENNRLRKENRLLRQERDI